MCSILEMGQLRWVLAWWIGGGLANSSKLWLVTLYQDSVLDTYSSQFGHTSLCRFVLLSVNWAVVHWHLRKFCRRPWNSWMAKNLVLHFMGPPFFPASTSSMKEIWQASSCVHIIDSLGRGWYIIISNFYSFQDWTQFATKYVSICCTYIIINKCIKLSLLSHSMLCDKSPDQFNLSLVHM